LRSQILVVDDDVASCELISELLRSAGSKPALSPAVPKPRALVQGEIPRGLSRYAHAPPDGLELAQHIRDSPINASTVIVMITGEQTPHWMKRAFEIGVHFFLFKPVERNKLLKLIRVAEHSN